jgi:hypothetical protein
VILAAAATAAIAAPHAMMLVLTVPHSLPFFANPVDGGCPPDVFTFTFSVET